MIILFCHPILNLQARYPFKVLDVTSYKDEFFLYCCSSNEHIHIANTKASLFEFPAYLSVFTRISNGQFLKKLGYLRNIVEVFFFARFERTKI